MLLSGTSSELYYTVVGVAFTEKQAMQIMLKKIWDSMTVNFQDIMHIFVYLINMIPNHTVEISYHSYMYL